MAKKYVLQERIGYQSGKTMKLLTLVCVGFRVGLADSSSTVEQPDYYDRLRVEEGATQDVATSSPSRVIQVTDSNTGRNLTLAHLPIFMPLIWSGNTSSLRVGALDESGMALLAIHHLNNKEASPIQEVRDLSDCSMRFTAELFDSRFDPVVSTRILTEILNKRSLGLQDPVPTAVVGAYRSATTSPLALLGGVKDIPQISPASTSADFEDAEQYPLLARTCPSSIGESRAAVDYYRKLGVSHVAVLSVPDPFGSAASRAFEDYANEMGIATVAATFSYSRMEDMPRAVETLKSTQYTHFFVIAFEKFYEPIMKAAIDAGIVGNGFFWMWYGPATKSLQRHLVFHQDSPLYMATTGIGVVEFDATVETEIRYPVSAGESNKPLDSAETSHGRVRESWRSAIADPEMIAYFQSKLPENVRQVAGSDSGASYNDDIPSWGFFVYDAVTAMGIAMCRMEETFFSGRDVVPQLRNTTFSGATGRLAFNEFGTREYTTMAFMVWNVNPFDEVDTEGMGRFTFSPTSSYVDGEWVDNPRIPFIYAGGTDARPASLSPVALDKNLVQSGVLVVGYVLVAIIVAFAVSCLIFVAYFRNNPVICASQPTFLSLITVGSVLIACSIIPYSMQEPMDSQWLDVACMAIPWLFFMGFSISFSALFVKTWRLYEIFLYPDLDRIFITSGDFVLWGVVMTGVNAILLLIWTLTFPWTFQRIPGSATDVLGRTTVSHGACRHGQGEDNGLPFWLTISILNLVVLVLVNYWSYRARELETEYKESLFIGFTLGSGFEAFLIGFPLLYVLDSSPDARYLVFVGIVFLCSLLVLLIIFVPKMIAISSDRKKERQQERAIQNYRTRARGREGDDDDYDFEDSNDSFAGEQRESEARTSEPVDSSRTSASADGTTEDESTLRPQRTRRREAGRHSELLRGVDPGIRVTRHPRAESEDDISMYSNNSGRFRATSDSGRL